MDLGSQAEAIPFITCGDLSGFDSETTYPLPEDYVCREPVQKPIDPPYAAAVELRKTSKLSDKTRDGAKAESKPVEAKYSVNTEKTENRVIVEQLEGLHINLPTAETKDSSGKTSRPVEPNNGDSSKENQGAQPLDSNKFVLHSSKPDVSVLFPQYLLPICCV